jgi:hypothetical protein
MKSLAALFLTLMLFAGCSKHPEPGVEPSRGEAAPCDGCAQGGDPKLTVVDSSIWMETVPGFSLGQISRPLGVLPFIQVEAISPPKCKFCQAFSGEGVEFDFGSAQDSLLSAVDSTLQPSLLMPGLQVPERDSVLFPLLLDSIAALPFVEGKALSDFGPWEERGNQTTEMLRNIPPSLRTKLSQLATRYGVNSLVMPVRCRVEMDPGAGEEGGYTFQILWMLFDAKKSQFSMIVHAKLTIETQGDAPPDRGWSHPFMVWLGKNLAQ